MPRKKQEVIKSFTDKPIPLPVLRILESVVEREGGFVNDPNDSGGPTKFGITLKTAKAWGVDLNKDGLVNIDDIRLIDEKIALKYYAEKIYFKNRIDLLQAGNGKETDLLREAVVDFIVHSGRYRAISMLQGTFNKVARPLRLATLEVDGNLGPITLTWIKNFCENYGSKTLYFISAYAIARREFLFRLADKRKKDRGYIVSNDGGKGGWIKRVEEFMLLQYRLDKDSFNQRIAAWSK